MTHADTSPQKLPYAVEFTGQIVSDTLLLVAVNGRMIDVHPALGHQLFDVSVTQRMGCVPTDTDEDNFDRKAQPFEVQHVYFSTWTIEQLT